MKQKIIAMAVIVLITGCVKTDPGPQQNPVIEGQVLSFTDNAPVSGATVVTSKCVEPDYYFAGCNRWEDTKYSTSGDGSFTMGKGDEYKMAVSKPGYWSCRITDGRANAGDIQYVTGTTGLKTFVIKLIEEVRINVHIKNTSVIADTSLLYFVAEGIHPQKFSANAVRLRKGIDTTFQYSAFGHLNNRMKVLSNDHYYSYLGSDSVMYSKDVFVPAGSNTSIDIQF
ncbi:hypothetical protein [Lacibacter sp.]|uniref:hypothetical protein n=1 Tax=Lacibacter sp. TaxID=1915409 RepID=UPI002B4B2687|nr:hypothetical protein [Lacibacter sp.]HLP36556.1 hypothetical protein [Lacibacter sp.]